MNKVLGAASLAALTLALSACQNFFDSSTAFASIQDLRHAVRDADVGCPGIHAIDTAGVGEKVLQCEDDLTLRWYTEDSELAKAVVGMTLNPTGQSFLTGKNWLVQGASEELDVLQGSLGGEITDYEK
ncbi:hypothetical protein E2F48_14125 [Arthrobacter crusticola]|uniref:Lipoprotein n=1 Tax=Arthrobacter crusticola TaxID=2547960 RepID=A0A4R5TQT5_9MICC|nr:hypothetical protein [Arthrobacter crusticola]TDK23929.1 hypothetical protein E2F48_14125 [Arthrobacter crusticola]